MKTLLQTRRGRFFFCLVFITHAKTRVGRAILLPLSCLFLIVLAPSAVLPRLVVLFAAAPPPSPPVTARERYTPKKSLGCFADVQNDRALEISAGDCPEGEQLMSAAVRSSNASSCGRAGSGKLSVFPLRSVVLVPGYVPPGRALDCPTPVELGRRRRRRGGPVFFHVPRLAYKSGGSARTSALRCVARESAPRRGHGLTPQNMFRLYHPLPCYSLTLGVYFSVL